jgi:hypothetical protein
MNCSEVLRTCIAGRKAVTLEEPSNSLERCVTAVVRLGGANGIALGMLDVESANSRGLVAYRVSHDLKGKKRVCEMGRPLSHP